MYKFQFESITTGPSPTIRENFIATAAVPPPPQFIPITTATIYGLIIFTVVPMILVVTTRKLILILPQFILLTKGFLLNQEKHE